jgi:hypothetical protein
VQQQPTPLVNEHERALLGAAFKGILIGMLVFGLISAGIVRLGYPNQSWGFTLAVGCFAGFWAGLFFGSAGGMALYQIRHGSLEDANDAHPPSPDERAPAPAPTVAPEPTVAPDAPPVRVAGEIVDTPKPTRVDAGTSG